jgi:hypothetical protein
MSLLNDLKGGREDSGSTQRRSRSPPSPVLTSLITLINYPTVFALKWPSFMWLPGRLSVSILIFRKAIFSNDIFFANFRFISINVISIY